MINYNCVRCNVKIQLPNNYPAMAQMKSICDICNAKSPETIFDQANFNNRYLNYGNLSLTENLGIILCR